MTKFKFQIAIEKKHSSIPGLSLLGFELWPERALPHPTGGELNIPFGWGLGIVFIKIITRFLVILQGAGFQILSLGFLRFFIREFSRMAPFPLLFIFLDLPICFCEGMSFDDHGGGEENPGDGILASGTEG